MSEGVFDHNIAELMQQALRKPEPDSTPVVGLGAMWLASELWVLQQQQAQAERQDHDEPPS